MELSDLEAAAPRFVRECRDIKSLSANTVSAYEQDLAEFMMFFGATESEREVDATFVGDYIQWLRETRELKPATIRRRIACLKSFCRWLKELGLAAQSPFDEKNFVVRIPKKLPRALTRSQASQVARAISGGGKAASIAQQGSARQLQPETLPDPCDPTITTHLAVSLMLASGMRVGELTAIKLGDIDPTCSVINITGKGSRERTVFLTNTRLVGELNRYVSARIEQCAADDVLLRNARGRALTPQALRLRLRKLGDRLAFSQRLTPHRFRHTAATILLEEGVDIRYVQRLLGHSSISTTEIYTHVTDVSLRQALERADVVGRVGI